MLLSWRKRQQSGKTKASRGARPAKPRKFRPLFETLENRVLLSVITINVTSNADQGGLPVSDGNNTFHGTLRQAINKANQATTSDGNSYTIKLQAGTTYQIASGGGTSEDMNAVGGDFDLTSLDPVTIQGATGPSGGSIVSGNNQDRVFDVATGSNLITFDTLTIEDGKTAGDGGGMRTAPGTMVKLTNVSVMCNTAGGDGGGIAAGYFGFSPSGGSGGSGGTIHRAGSLASGGSLTIVNSTIFFDLATGSGGGTGMVNGAGGGIAVQNETVNISNKTSINFNSAGQSGANNVIGEGGGLYTGGPSGGSNVTIDNSTITANTAFGTTSGGGQGGGAWIGPGDTLTLQNNSTVGGPSGGQNTAAASTGSGGFGGGGAGGGIYGEGGSTVNVNSTSSVSYNLAAGSNNSGGGGSGGGLYSDGIVKLNNSTVSHNTAGTFQGSGGSGGSGEGGGVFVHSQIDGATFTSTNSHIDYNTAQGGRDFGGPGAAGGGIALVNENATILGGTVSHNTAEGNSHSGGGGSGGGIFAVPFSGGNVSLNFGATADGNTVNPVTIADNTAGGGNSIYRGGAGGGIFLGPRDILKLTNSTVRGNQAQASMASSGGGGSGGGICAFGTFSPSGGSVTIRSSTIDGNSAFASHSQSGFGGGIFMDTEVATILSSTISNNHADFGEGGGIFATESRPGVAPAAVKPNQSEGTPGIMVTNSTIANNTAGFAGGIESTYGGVMQLTNDTVAFNQAYSGGGVVAGFESSVRVWNTIIAKNTELFSGGRETDVSGTFFSLGHNLIGLVNGASGGNNGFSSSKGDLFSTNSNAPLDPGLNPLADNGGPTLTCSLKLTPKSPAIDAGDDAALSVTGPYDQRGPGHPRKQGRHIDIGPSRPAPASAPAATSSPAQASRGRQPPEGAPAWLPSAPAPRANAPVSPMPAHGADRLLIVADPTLLRGGWFDRPRRACLGLLP